MGREQIEDENNHDRDEQRQEQTGEIRTRTLRTRSISTREAADRGNEHEQIPRAWRDAISVRVDPFRIGVDHFVQRKNVGLDDWIRRFTRGRFRMPPKLSFELRTLAQTLREPRLIVGDLLE